MRYFLLLLLTASSYAIGYSRSFDEKITEAMNKADWFALDSVYSSAPKDSISDFLDVLSRGLIGNRFNRPDVSVPAFEELLGKHSDELAANQLMSYAFMCAVDLSRVGDNAKAASTLAAARDLITKDGNGKATAALEKYIKLYTALSNHNPYTIKIEGGSGRVPFKTVPIGKPEDKGMHIHLEESSINGLPAEITFDTGAAVNVISSSLIERYNLLPVDVETKVSGIKSQSGTFAIAPQMKIGNITLTDVPFYVMDITANNPEADRYLQSINIIVGSDLMLQLKDLTIDFENSCLLVPAEAPAKSEIMPNLCFSTEMNLLAKGRIRDNELLMNIDSGDSGYGYGGRSFYNKNKQFIKKHGEPANVSKAGIGGIEIAKAYKVPDMALDLGGNTVVVPSLSIMAKTDYPSYEFNLGLKALMLYKSIRFNLVDFVISTESY